MNEDTKNPVTTETDKLKKAAGRAAAERGQDSKFLNQESLEDDLVDPKEVDDHADDDNEWETREDQNHI